MIVSVSGKEYEVPNDGIIDSHRHGELFWMLTMSEWGGIALMASSVDSSKPVSPPPDRYKALRVAVMEHLSTLTLPRLSSSQSPDGLVEVVYAREGGGTALFSLEIRPPGAVVGNSWPARVYMNGYAEPELMPLLRLIAEYVEDGGSDGN